jgi:uncharacterized OB-fold protein
VDVTAALHRQLTQDRPRADHSSGRLAGARCLVCRAPSWPARSVCYRCGSAELAAVSFEPTGSLLTYTTVWVPRPGLETPYTLGQVHVDDDGPVVFGHIRGLPEATAVPCRVRLFLADDPAATPWYWFGPEHDPDGRSPRTQNDVPQTRPSHG